MTPAAPRRSRSLLLALLAVLLCASTTLVGGLAEPASAAPKPAKVKGVKLKQPKVDGTKASFKVKWKRAARATSYKVKWRVPGGPAKKEKTSKTKLVIANLAQGTDYCVQVRAFNGKRKGKWSKQVCRTTARLDPVHPVWVDRQWIEGATVALNLRWNEVAGATSYELAYVTGEGDIQKDKKTQVAKAGATGTGTASVAVGGLTPDKTYCFQVRATGPLGTGAWGVAGCKYTSSPSRAAGGPLKVNMMTWNMCSASDTVACAAHPWAPRSAGARARVLAAAPDVLALQEAGQAIQDFAHETTGLEGYSEACRVGDGYPEGTNWRNQSMIIRDAKFTVAKDSADAEMVGGYRFLPQTHGGCWAVVDEVGTGRRLVLADLHLTHPAAGSDQLRQDQMAAFWNAIAADPNTHVGADPLQPLLPILFAGDFNSERNRPLDGPRLILNSGGYSDAFDVAESYNSLPYLNSFNNWTYPGPTSLRWGAHIDRVFVPPGARVTGWQMEPVLAADGTHLSDHSPVRVTVELP